MTLGGVKLGRCDDLNESEEGMSGMLYKGRRVYWAWEMYIYIYIYIFVFFEGREQQCMCGKKNPRESILNCEMLKDREGSFPGCCMQFTSVKSSMFEGLISTMLKLCSVMSKFHTLILRSSADKKVSLSLLTDMELMW